MLATDEPGEVRAGLVVPNHRDEGGGGFQRDEVAHDVAGAAWHGDLARDGEDGDRGFRGDAVDGAVDVTVQHHVSNHQDAGVGEAFDVCTEVRAGDHG